MKYVIPYYNMKALEKKIKALSKKFPIKYEVSEEPTYVQTPGTPPEMKCFTKCYEVLVEGSYKIEDWEFVAVLEHGDKGNIIRNATDKELPIKFRTCGPHCDHCNTKRLRNNTIVLYNNKLKEYKQVGSSCLLEYTGLDAEVVASYNSYIMSIEELEEISRVSSSWDPLEEELKGQRNDYSFSANKIKTIAYDIVSKNGYERETTRRLMYSKLMELEQGECSLPDYSKELDKITEWNNNSGINEETSSEYIWNCHNVWNLKFVEGMHFLFIASYINTYLKEEQERLASSNSEYVGNIGDRIDIEIASSKVLYSKEYYYGWNRSDTIFVHRIIDPKGNIYILSTGKYLINYCEDGSGEPIRKIRATVKAHEEYKGAKQTVITRFKALE